MDGTIKVRVENGVYGFLGDRFLGVAPPFFKQQAEIPPQCRSVSWDLQFDDDERLFSLGVKAVTRFPSLSSLFEGIHFVFFLSLSLSISCLVLRICHCVESGLNPNHALDFGDIAHSCARLDRATQG